MRNIWLLRLSPVAQQWIIQEQQATYKFCLDVNGATDSAHIAGGDAEYLGHFIRISKRNATLVGPVACAGPYTGCWFG